MFFVNSYVGGGAEKVCLNLAAQLYKRGIESDFITIYDAKADFDIPDYIHTYSLGIDAHYSPIKILLEIMKGVSVVNIFLSDKDYVMITAHLPMAQILASLTRVGKRCLYVMHVTQHLVDRQNSKLYKLGLRIFLKKKKIITVSKGLENELIDEYGIDSGTVATIYNPCATSNMESQMQADSPHIRPYILVMGRLEKQKDPLLALELYEKGKFSYAYDLIYLGKGTLEEELQRKIAEYHLQSHVYLAGFQKNTGQWLKHTSLLLSCSRQEGLPMNLIEALTCGTPVVATDCPYGPNEILTGELAKFLMGSEQAFQDKITLISSALESYPEITSKYYEKFKDEVIVQKYLEVWENWFTKM